jgi:prepilin-type N-terminal cleavage/methylation domain-containing protein
MNRSQLTVTRRSRRMRRGFTLIETALATIIVGVGVLSIVIAQQAFHRQNSWSTHATTATNLGNEIREMTMNMPRHDPVTGNTYWGPEPNELWVGDFDDLDDFDGDTGDGLIFEAPADGTTPNGPINAYREIIPNMRGWSQTVRVFSVDPFEITAVQADGATDFLLVQVTITYQGPHDASPQEMTTVSWIAPN